MRAHHLLPFDPLGSNRIDSLYLDSSTPEKCYRLETYRSSGSISAQSTQRLVLFSSAGRGREVDASLFCPPSFATSHSTSVSPSHNPRPHSASDATLSRDPPFPPTRPNPTGSDPPSTRYRIPFSSRRPRRTPRKSTRASFGRSRGGRHPSSRSTRLRGRVRCES